MSSATRLGAMAMAVVLVLSVATPAVATEPADISVSVGNTTYTVEVTHNGTPVNDTDVRVVPTDPENATYEGDAGATDENGTVPFDLPANETEVNISTTFNGTETTITYLLPAAGHQDEPTWDGEGPFGRWLTSILKNLVPPDSGTPLGQIVSDIVTKNNPGSEHRSDKANPGGNGNGAPDHAGGPNDDSETEADGKRGPPGHAGPPDDAESDDDDERGPPDHAKGDDDGEAANADEDPENDEDETEEAEEESEEDGDGDDNEANGNGNNGQGNGG